MSTALHILVADDEPEITSYLQDYLASLGHRVDAAGNGIEALNCIAAAHRQQDGYHLLLIDVRMPLLDGLSLVRELRRAKDPVDIAFMTGDESLLAQLDAESQQLNSLMVIAKPFDPQQLQQLVDFVALRSSRRISSAAQTATVPPPTALERAPPNSSASMRPNGGDEYQPTTTSHAAPGDRPQPGSVRRSQVFEPGAPPAVVRPTRTPLPGAYPSPRPQGGMTPPPGGPRATPLPEARQGGRVIQPPPAGQPPPARTTSRIAQPLDPRLSPGLPPVPAPVAQPSRDFRTTSRIAPLDQAPPRDPRTTSRVAPAEQPPRQLPQIDATGRRGTPPPVAQPPAQTGNQRRSPPPQPLPPPPGSAPARPPGRMLPVFDTPQEQSTRLRRSVGGPPPSVESTDRSSARMVGCAHCGGAFRAVIKLQPYNLVCVHCGQLNRIDP